MLTYRKDNKHPHPDPPPSRGRKAVESLKQGQTPKKRRALVGPARGSVVVFTLYFLILAGSISAVWAGEAVKPLLLQEPKRISEVIIRMEGPAAGRGRLDELAENLIRIKKNDLFSSAMLEASIDALRQSNRFQTIHVDQVEAEDRLTLLFLLTPFRVIRDMRIRGAFPLFEKDITTRMSLSPGDVFTVKLLEEQAEVVSGYLKEQGYPAPKVRIEAEKEPKDGHWMIDVHLDKGRPLVLKSLAFEGNIAVSRFRLRSMMNVRPSIFRLYIPKRFVQKTLKNDVAALLDYYREKGFVDCRISTRVENISGAYVRVVVTIDEGPRYILTFTGNKNISNRKLKKNSLRFSRGNSNDSGLKRTAAAIREMYREAGFADARVSFEDAPESDGLSIQRNIRFVIEEGNRLLVTRVSIKGNDAIRTKSIQKEVLTQKKGIFRKGHFLSHVLEEDINSIRALYRKNGFMNTQVVPELIVDGKSDQVSVDINIDENARTLVSKIDFRGLNAVSTEAALKAIGLRKGEAFREYMLKSDGNILSAMISEAGYPFVSVTGKAQVGKDRTSAEVTYDVIQGPRVEMGQIYYSGNFRTKNELLTQSIGLSPGDPFSSSKMLKGQKSLRDMAIFDSVRFNTIGLEEKWEQITLLVDVEEKKPYFVEFSLGYETQRGMFVQSKVGDHNLMGLNKNAWFGAGVSQTGYRAESEILEPHLLGSPVSMTTGLFAEEEKLFNQEFGTAVFGANVGFSYKPFQRVTTGLNLRFEQRDQFGESTLSSQDEDLFKPRPLLALTPSVSFDTRDSFIYPKKGVFASVSADISKGVLDSLDNFVKYRLDVRAYVTPVKPLTFAWSGRIGYIAPYGTTKAVADDQLFFLGGISDVRGVDENLLFFDEAGSPLGGRNSIFTSLEARIALGGGFEMPLFFDAGRLSETQVQGISDEFRYAVGTGIRYLTPIGPIGFLYGKNLDPQKGAPSGRIHFSIGYTF